MTILKKLHLQLQSFIVRIIIECSSCYRHCDSSTCHCSTCYCYCYLLFLLLPLQLLLALPATANATVLLSTAVSVKTSRDCLPLHQAFFLPLHIFLLIYLLYPHLYICNHKRNQSKPLFHLLPHLNQKLCL